MKAHCKRCLRLGRTVFGLGLALLAAAEVERLEAQISTASLEVTVAGLDGRPLSGVTAALENTATGFARKAATNGQGTAMLAALPPGIYRARFTLQGFSPFESDGIELHMGQAARLAVTLSPAARLIETITVSSSVPLTEPFKTDSSANVLPEQIAALPLPNRDVQRLAFLAPGVERERSPIGSARGSPVVGSGGDASQSTTFVDGLDFTGAGGEQLKIHFSQDAVSELRVINRSYDSEIGGTVGGALSIVTRSGTNQIHGSAFGFHHAGNGDSSRAHDGLTAGGPLRPDRSHYFVAGEQIAEKNISFVRPGGAFASLATDAEHPFNQTLGFAKLSHRSSDAVSWAASLVSERYREKNAGVGGVSDVSNGYAIHRDNWNLAGENVALLSGRQLNELRAQTGRQRFDQPPNSTAVSEWFSNGNTLASGGNLLGHLLAASQESEIRETWHASFAGERGTHDVKLGSSFRSTERRQRFDLFQYGLFIYLNDTRDLPVTYLYGEGSSDVRFVLKQYGLFLQDDWRPLPRLTLNLGVRYDLDDGGNHPGFTHPLVPKPRRRDTDDVQPRAAFSWDLSGDGRSVVRGGAGMFRGRTQGIAGIERQMNGITGYLIRTRVNGALFGLNAPPFVLDPSRPAATGILLPPDISLLAPTLETPESVQASLGWTRALPHGFFFEAEGLYSRGRKELVIHNVNFGGNSNPVRLNPTYNQIDVYSNAGRSEYRALILQLNGALENGDLLTASLTLGSRKYVADAKDYEPPFGYPSDPANLAAEYGRGRTDERLRCMLTGVFHLPWQLTLAPVYEYGSGQPWNRLLGYDWNGDGRISDRAAGVRRNDQDGPPFRQLDLRLTKSVALSGRQRLDLIVEGFNVFDTVNGDVTSIDSAEFLSGPTLQNPGLPYRPNPRFGKARAAFPGRTIQLGLRWVL